MILSPLYASVKAPDNPFLDSPLFVAKERFDEGKRALARLDRWRLQWVARGVLADLPKSRVRFCFRHLRGDSNAPGAAQVWMDQQKASYQGLMVCGSVWICPVCAAKISERRRQELVDSLAKYRDQGGPGRKILFLTLTFPHRKNQSLQDLLDKFSKARGLFRNRKTWKRKMQGLGFDGDIRALEVTHGKNGWHVHTHELIFINGHDFRNLPLCPKNTYPENWFLEQLRRDLLPAWQSACASSGLSQPNKHGLTVQNGILAADYVSKWGVESEMTKSHVKHGNEKGRTPWDLLRLIDQAGPGTEEALEASKLFVEYAKAFKGRRQLTWSKGLKSLLGLTDQTDQEIAEAAPERGAELLGSFTRYQWQQILKTESRGKILRAAELGGWSGVLEYLNKITREHNQVKKECEHLGVLEIHQDFNKGC